MVLLQRTFEDLEIEKLKEASILLKKLTCVTSFSAGALSDHGWKNVFIAWTHFFYSVPPPFKKMECQGTKNQIEKDKHYQQWILLVIIIMRTRQNERKYLWLDA